VKKLLLVLFGLLTIGGLLFASGVVPLSIQNTVMGMRSAAQGKVGSFMLQNDKLLVFVWQNGGKYGFALIPKNAQDALQEIMNFKNGTGAPVEDVSRFVNDVENMGYEYVQPEQLPAPLMESLLSVKAYLMAIGQSFTTIWMIPMITYDEQGWMPDQVSQ
jgi:hypothetical protein